MAITTIQQAIDRGQVSIYLSGNDNAKGALFGPRIAAPGSPVTIAIITDALMWGLDGGAQTDQDLREMANYLVWLTGMYGQQAEFILDGSGGGTVVPVSPGASLPSPLDFIVDGSTTPIISGQSTLTISNFIGYNLSFDRGGQPQYTTNPGDGTSYFSWNRVTGAFFMSPAAMPGEPLRLTPIG